jgi:hypothetical protein
MDLTLSPQVMAHQIPGGGEARRRILRLPEIEIEGTVSRLAELAHARHDNASGAAGFRHDGISPFQCSPIARGMAFS